MGRFSVENLDIQTDVGTNHDGSGMDAQRRNRSRGAFTNQGLGSGRNHILSRHRGQPKHGFELLSARIENSLVDQHGRRMGSRYAFGPHS